MFHRGLTLPESVIETQEVLESSRADGLAAIELDSSGTIIAASSYAISLFGEQHIIGRALRNILNTDDQIGPAITCLIPSAGSPIALELRLLREDSILLAKASLFQVQIADFHRFYLTIDIRSIKRRPINNAQGLFQQVGAFLGKVLRTSDPAMHEPNRA